MNRRVFFSLLFAPFLAKFLPCRVEDFVREDLQVLNTCDPNVVRLLQADIEKAYRTMSVLLAQDIYYNNGQKGVLDASNL